MSESIEAVQQAALAELANVDDTAALQAWKSRYIGAKGQLKDLMNRIGSLPAEERKAYGQQVNALKEALMTAFEAREAELEAAALDRTLAEGAVDITLPARPRRRGRLHPSSQTLRRIYDIWADMGFQIFLSRDVEDDDTNFTLLNFPPDHPARDMQDTFYTTEPGVILRTHTSPGQIRSMRAYGENGTQPMRVILPGMCYRFEQITHRSEVQFHQVEGIAIGRSIRMSDLKGTFEQFVKRLFGPSTALRFRTSYFPFTEPSMEIDVECFVCGGRGCRICKYTGWLEIAGSGMIHPNVLRNGGYDPSVWSGFAFGMGPERITLLRHAIEDIRYFWANDQRFLHQF
jgi:phenylalanyl-tRNA synthetase alpha chain